MSGSRSRCQSRRNGKKFAVAFTTRGRYSGTAQVSTTTNFNLQNDVIQQRAWRRIVER